VPLLWDFRGGIVGKNTSSTITSSYWDSDVNNLKAQATFVGWDYTNVWSITEGVTLPYLQSNPTGTYPIGEWLVSHNIRPNDTNSSPDSDNALNIMEFAFDTDPNQFDYQKVWASIDPSKKLSINFATNHSDLLSSGLNTDVMLRGSNDLANWNYVGFKVISSSFTGGKWEYKVEQQNPIDSGGYKFLRLLFTK